MKIEKSVLISINKPHTDNIRLGLKKWEIRKKMPNYFTDSFIVYIYETKRFGGLGKIIGEFVCDYFITFDCKDGFYFPSGSTKRQTCLTNSEMFSYGKGKVLYAWHISNLLIYDVPSDIKEFNFRNGSLNYISRPPQSWCYLYRLVEG